MKGTCFERELILTQTARMNPGKAVPSAAKLHRERPRDPLLPGDPFPRGAQSGQAEADSRGRRREQELLP